MTEYEHIEHTFAPVYDADSLVLILGTLPSVKSRENHFYYGHKQNRFWKVMADLCGEPVPETIEEKKKMLLTHHIAIWDVIQSCDIKGSSDSSIRNVEPTDIRRILAESQITRIYANGNKAMLPATFAAFLLFPCPSVLARSAFVPTPVPIPTATISICTGKIKILHKFFISAHVYFTKHSYNRR